MYRPELIRAVTAGAVEIEYGHAHTSEGRYTVCGDPGDWTLGFTGKNDDGSTFRVLDLAGPYEDLAEAERYADEMNADLAKLRVWLATLTDTDRKYLDQRAAQAA